MIVCHCKAVSDRDVRGAIERGAGDIEGVTERCGAGADCGACHASIKAVLDERAVRVLLDAS